MNGHANESMETMVRCRSGFRADEKPLEFHFRGKTLQVSGIVESWYTPDHLCFKVEAEDGGIYLLEHHEYQDSWRVRRVR